MDKIFINKYNVTHPNIVSEKPIAFFSDLHSDTKKLEKILYILEELRISTLLIGGDLVDCKRDNKRSEVIKKLLEEFAKTTNIFIAIGNHDIVFNNKKNNKNYFNNLSNINVSDVPSDTSIITKWSVSEDLDISALNMPISYYWDKEPKKEYDELIRVLDYLETDINKFNILLCHTPKNIIRSGIIDKYLKKINKFNLILSGHVHGGLVPVQLRKKSFGGGFLGPSGTKLPDHAYGIVQSDNVISLTSGGVIKISDQSAIEFKDIIDKLYPPEIEIINLKHANKFGITKVRKKEMK